MRHDPSVPQFYSQREMIGLERKAAGLGRSGDLKKSLSQAQKQKHQKIVAKSALLYSPSSLPLNDLGDHGVLTTLTNLDSLNQPPPKKRRLSADKALARVSISEVEVGSENIEIDSISLGKRKCRM